MATSWLTAVADDQLSHSRLRLWLQLNTANGYGYGNLTAVSQPTATAQLTELNSHNIDRLNENIATYMCSLHKYVFFM